MSVSDDIAVLRKFPLFQSFSRENLRLLVFGAEQLVLKKGDVLFYESEPAESAFIVISGEIELSRFSREADIILGMIGPDEMIGETALIVPNLTRNNTARIKEDSRILKLSQSAFRRFLDEFPKLVPTVHNYFDKRVSQLATTLNRLTSSSL